MKVNKTGCCGVLELADISTLTTPKEVIDQAVKEIEDFCKLSSYNAPYIFFTGVVDRVTSDHASSRYDDYALKLAEYIKAERLGEVIDNVPVRKNWTGNGLKMYIWFPDYTALRALRASQLSTRLDVFSTTISYARSTSYETL